MKPIKFRAWLKSIEEMVEVLEIDFYNKEVAYIWTEQVSDYELEQTREVDKLNDVILMQYTGLKDKNGVDIYEGDILYVEQQSRGTIDQFIPHKRSVAVRYEAKDTAYVFDEKHGQAIGLYTIPGELEVIGNIYENPELLEEENAKN